MGWNGSAAWLAGGWFAGFAGGLWVSWWPGGLTGGLVARWLTAGELDGWRADMTKWSVSISGDIQVVWKCMGCPGCVEMDGVIQDSSLFAWSFVGLADILFVDGGWMTGWAGGLGWLCCLVGWRLVCWVC